IGKHARRRRPVSADITRPAIHCRLSCTELGRATHVFPGGSGLLHGVGPGELAPEPARRSWLRAVRFGAGAGVGPLADVAGFARGAVYRSEEHTSELQSRFDLVCRLLLEKKKVSLFLSVGRVLQRGCIIAR